MELQKPELFRYANYAYDSESGNLALNYAAGPYEFTEEITFLGKRRNLSELEKRVLDKVFRALHIAAGVSYYKLFLCPKAVVETGDLNYNEAVFFNTFYKKGLAEFSYRNDVEIKSIFKGKIAYKEPENITLQEGEIVPIGGGKDSAVVVEILRAMGHNPYLFAVGDHKAVKDVIDISGFSSLAVKRKLSPLLIELNKYENTFNGHVPVTGILSFIMVASAIIYGFSTVVMSNERSANTGNLIRKGEEVNHQWSKSFEFENLFSNFVKQNLIPDFKYFSLLREYSELAITRMFAGYEKYHDVFTSCNAAFKFQPENRVQRWCCVCDKCRFIFLALAPFLSRNKMIEIFGRDLLAEPEQERGYMELLGLAAFRPFECVGEVEESVAALTLLSSLDEWRTSYIVKRLYPMVQEKYKDNQDWLRHVFTKANFHNIPQEFLNVNG